MLRTPLLSLRNIGFVILFTNIGQYDRMPIINFLNNSLYVLVFQPLSSYHLSLVYRFLIKRKQCPLIP